MIAQDPIFSPAVVKRPLQWVTFTIINTTTFGQIDFAEVVIFVDGVNVATTHVKPFDKLGAGPVFTFPFKVNVAKICADLKAPKIQTKSKCFGDMSAAYSAASTDCSGTVNLTIDYYYINANGMRTIQPGASDATKVEDFFIGVQQHEETQSLAAFIPAFLSRAPFLTKAPFTQSIALNNSMWISTISSTGGSVQIVTFDSAGLAIDTGVFSAPLALGNQQVSFGIGPNEIRNTTFDLFGSVNIDNPLVASYTVIYGSGVFFAFSEIYRFNMCSCAAGFVRLHWINRLGGTDAYTFISLNEVDQTTTSDTGQKALDWNVDLPNPHNINDGGAFKYNTKATLGRNLESSWLTPEEALWLSELFSSEEVYRETTGGLVRLLPPDGTQEISTNSDSFRMVRLKFKAIDSNQRIFPQN